MHNNRLLVEARIKRFMAERLTPAVWPVRVPLSVSSWEAPGEPVPFSEAVAGVFSPCATGSAWGRPWGTTWFRVSGTVPEEWASSLAGSVSTATHDDGGASAASHRLEAVVDLGFTTTMPGFQAEGLVYSSAGRVIKALEPLNVWVPLTAVPGSSFEFYVEAASNPNVIDGFDYAPTALGSLSTARSDPLYTFRRAELALFDVQAWELGQDFWTLNGLMHELPVELPRRHEILRALEAAVNAVDPSDVAGTAAAGRACLAEVLAAPAYASAHRMHAVGHAHIDSAWLWPVRETVRKVARTFSNVLELMDRDPGFVFTASSAQQYAWLRSYYPDLFERVAEKVRSGQFVPAGGMWVESDTNMPGGEALARQFVAGKRFFLENFGVEPLDVWLPDSFGYSAALPQIVQAAGSRWFLTQKISWNETNLFPHHSFRWEGIDGTQVFTHFPPVDTYNSDLSGGELAHAQRTYREKGAANTSLVPFGWGDGGGGPTREMLAAAARISSLEGSPAVTLSSPSRFFETASAEYSSAPVWSGELYLEFHRGTYTSQARTKKGNRRSEHLLREAELWCSVAALRTDFQYPHDTLEAAWHTVLLQQFHDILPGSSIAWVHEEAERNYAEVASSLSALIDAALRALLGSGSSSVALNAGPFAVDGVPGLGGGAVNTVSYDLTRDGSSWAFSSPALRLTVDENGLFTSLVSLSSGREVLPADMPGNVFQLFRDTPNQWDAWDIDEHYKFNVVELTEAASVDAVGSVLRVERQFGKSRLVQRISLSGDGSAVNIAVEVDWHEQQKLLKLAFPVDMLADRAASEIQFGHIHRPTHTNTSWDAARFETVAHRWVHVGETAFGVAVANDSTYGHDISRVATPSGGSCTLVRASLLRGPLFPDPEADQGSHNFEFSLRPSSGIPEAVASGYRLNLPLRSLSGVGATSVEPLVSLDNLAVVVEAVKLAEDRSGDVIVRLYEAFGGRASAVVSPSFSFDSVVATDLLERKVSADFLTASEGGLSLSLSLRPFQLVTLRFAVDG
ncbi:glycoside hydrolase family 38 C-terminal domain-containing protein [Arthrobacter sp. H5]|uniref:alpha-mannosidase n=1 Tax=Arthrobacter sp. H5 TaxID=1267973 RepID=UPI000483B290|nr:glycoside hydrolase family 38 C-terminal domain-containing protein [Arthrobacter sp. H5]